MKSSSFWLRHRHGARVAGKHEGDTKSQNDFPENLARAANGKESLFFIPAHRSLLISDGWAVSEAGL